VSVIIFGIEEFEVGEAIAAGEKCGLSDGKLVRRTRDHALVGRAAEALEPGDRVKLDGDALRPIRP
jgi:hypothetical protein